MKEQMTYAIIFVLQQNINSPCPLVDMNFCNMEKVNIFVQCPSMQTICHLTNIY